MNRGSFALARIACGGMLLSVACAVGAADTDSEAAVTIEKDVRTFVVNRDGSFVMHADLTLLVNHQRAVSDAAVRRIRHNSTLETLNIIEAYTQKQDGRRVEVGAERIKLEQEARARHAPIFQDTRVTALIYPDVAPGDRIVLRYAKTRSTPLFPGHFEDLHVPAAADIRRYQLIYDMPDSLPLYADVRGFTASSVVAGPGRTRYQWNYVPVKRLRAERGSVDYADYGTHVAVSTFADFAALGNAYDARARDMVAVTPAILEIAQKNTAGLGTAREKALALSNWVRRNIRYVAVYIGAGGVVPHSAESVLSNRYGDCKDHVALLEALLAAVGIESTPALINHGAGYRLMKVPTLGVLNHVLAYVPALNLYLDPSADAVAAGYLPPGDIDKPVLLTRTGVLSRTPASQPNLIVNSAEYRVRADGAAEFLFTSTASGWPAEPTRMLMRSISTDAQAQVVENMLQKRGQNGSGQMDLGDLAGSADEYTLAIRGVSENLIRLPGPVGIAAGTTFADDIAQMMNGMNSERKRTQPFVCLSRRFIEETRFRLPPEITVVAIPTPVTLHDAQFDYSATYERQGNVVLIRRALDFHHTGAVCSPEEHEAMRPAIEQIVRDLRSQLVVQAQKTTIMTSLDQKSASSSNLPSTVISAARIFLPGKTARAADW